MCILFDPEYFHAQKCNHEILDFSFGSMLVLNFNRPGKAY